MEEKDIKRIFEVYKGPFEYDSNGGQYIWDANLNMVATIRGWGYLQKFSDGAKIQDDIGQFITNCLNKYYYEQIKIKNPK